MGAFAVLNPLKLVLEALLVVVAIRLFGLKPDPSYRRLLLGFTALAVVLNGAFYFAAVWPFFLAQAQSSGIGESGLLAFIVFDVTKWGFLAYVLCNAALAVRSKGGGGGFALLRATNRWWRTALAGAVAGVVATALAYGLSIAEHRMGVLGALPWSYMRENRLFTGLAFWGGVHNLAGEEILTRLGAQSILLYLLRGRRGTPLVALVVSSLFFELWHNGFQEVYWLNFAASCVFGLAYHYRGYESAALGHCTGDWLALLVLPRLVS
jgi:hypothetical protein